VDQGLHERAPISSVEVSRNQYARSHVTMVMMVHSSKAAPNSTMTASTYRFCAMGSGVLANYTWHMSKYLLRVLGIPTGIIALCALFVLVQRYSDQTMALQFIGLFARVAVLVSFVYFVHQWRQTVWTYWGGMPEQATQPALTARETFYNWTEVGRAAQHAARTSEG
jgi:hypothetical protein